MVEASALVAAMPLVRTLEIQAMVEGLRGTLVAGRTWAEGGARTTAAAETLAAAAAATSVGAAVMTMAAAVVRAFSPSSRILMLKHRQMDVLPVSSWSYLIAGPLGYPAPGVRHGNT